jgi:4-aminobutyrate aminotransferase/(S)-3-amino-2-methylpropionate transaminase
MESVAEMISKKDKLYQQRKNLVPNALGIFNPSSVQYAHGSIMIDADGKELIDFAGGIGVLNAGHCPPIVVKAIQEQAEKLIHSSFNVAVYGEYLELAEKLVEILPHGDATKVMLLNSGAEAVENVIKIAKQATKRPAIIAYDGGFHGRTMMAMSLTSKVAYKSGCGPLRLKFIASIILLTIRRRTKFQKKHMQNRKYKN